MLARSNGVKANTRVHRGCCDEAFVRRSGRILLVVMMFIRAVTRLVGADRYGRPGTSGQDQGAMDPWYGRSWALPAGERSIRSAQLHNWKFGNVVRCCADVLGFGRLQRCLALSDGIASN